MSMPNRFLEKIKNILPQSAQQRLGSAYEQAVGSSKERGNVPTRPRPTPAPTHAIASLDDGMILLSNGRTIMSPELVGSQLPTGTALDQARARALLQNTIDQTPFTPEAERRVRGLNARAYGTTLQSHWSNNSGGFAEPERINFNIPHTLNQEGSAWPYQVALHEITHALDDNLVGQTHQNSVMNSDGLYNTMRGESPEYANTVRHTLKSNPNLYDYSNPRTRDLEAAANAGQLGGYTQTEFGPEVSGTFSKMYQPMSKAMNSTPMYPSPQTQAIMRPYVPEGSNYSGALGTTAYSNNR